VPDSIYKIKPDIQRDFVTEHLNDKQRYEELHALHVEDANAENSGDYKSAIALYEKLLSKSKFGFFKLIAESGLYRSTAKRKRDKT